MLFAELASFQPFDEHQLAAADQIRFAWQSFGAQLYTRENPVCHFTASAWIVNPACTHALMVYHNIYHSWSWTGGHNDGNPDFQSVARREAVEETARKGKKYGYTKGILETCIREGKQSLSASKGQSGCQAGPASYDLEGFEKLGFHIPGGKNSHEG